jgi:uncharacterized repeat protein (TIGR01451 family)
MYRLRISSLLVISVLSLTVIIATGTDLSAQEEDVLLYLPIILKDHDPSQPYHYLSVDKTALASQVQPGGVLTYTIRYGVGGNEPAPGLTLVDTLPPSTTLKTCTGDVTCDQMNGTATWNLGTVAPFSTGLVTLTVQVDALAISGTVLANQVTLSDLSGLSATETVTTPVESTSEAACELQPITFSSQVFVDPDAPSPFIILTLIQGGASYEDFDWVSWNPAFSDSNRYLIEELDNPSLAGTDFTNFDDPSDHVLSVDDWVSIASDYTGAEIDNRVASLVNQTIRVPIYDMVSGGAVHISHIALLRVISVVESDNREIVATFLRYDDQVCEE